MCLKMWWCRGVYGVEVESKGGGVVLCLKLRLVVDGDCCGFLPSHRRILARSSSGHVTLM